MPGGHSSTLVIKHRHFKLGDGVGDYMATCWAGVGHANHGRSWKHRLAIIAQDGCDVVLENGHDVGSGVMKEAQLDPVTTATEADCKIYLHSTR